jgi:hypothetical protein
MDDIDEGSVPPPPEPYIPPAANTSSGSGDVADIDEDSVDDNPIPPITAFQSFDAGDGEITPVDDAPVVILYAEPEGTHQEKEVHTPQPADTAKNSITEGMEETLSNIGYDFRKHVQERRKSLSPTLPTPSHFPIRGRTSSESSTGSAEPQNFKHVSHISEEDLHAVPPETALLLSPKVLSGERPRLTLRTSSRKSVSASTPRVNGTPLGSERVPFPGGEAFSSTPALRLEDLDIRISVLNTIHPARVLRKRLRLKELFRDQDIVPYEVVKESLLKEQEDATPTFSFPYLSHNGCSWGDVLKYLVYEETRNGRGKATRLEVNLRINITHIGQHCDVYSPVAGWMETCVQKLCSLQVPAIADSSEERVRQVVLQQASRVSEDIAWSLSDDLLTAENYVLKLEAATSNDSPTPTTSAPTTPVAPHTGDDGYANMTSDAAFASADLVSLITLSTSSDVWFNGIDAVGLQDGDGYISRKEWRRWMTEKEAIITKSNREKAELIKVCGASSAHLMC